MSCPVPRGLALCLAILVGAIPAAAQVIDVRSGEHAGFSRLVLDIGATRDWTLSGDGRSRVLSLDPPVAGFDVEDVFDMIPRNRLSALRSGETLTLDLGCDCDITTDRYRDRYLVLDIADRTGTADPLAPPPEDPPREDPRPEALARIARQAAAEQLPDLTTLLTGTATRAVPHQDPEPPPAAPPPVDMAEAARLMAEQLARAAASGLLVAAPDRPLSDADPLDAPASSAPAAAPDVLPTAQTTGPAVVPRPDLPIRAATALDLMQAPPQGPLPRGPALACAGARLDLADWSAGQGVAHGLGALRRDLVDDRDRLNRDAVLALARHYLYHGFGAEAAHWLSRIAEPPDDLLVIAAVVDGAETPRFPPEPDPFACSDEELLWRYLGGAFEDRPPTPDQADRLQRGTAALPAILRDQIGPRMARHLHADGFPEQARNLRDMLHRGDRIAPAALLALDLDLGLLTAGDPAVTGALELALRDDAADPAGSMARALRVARDMDVPVEANRLVAAAALLRETGIGPQSAALWSELVLAQARAGQLDQALILLSEAETLPQATRDAALTALVADRTASGDTAALLALARAHGASWTAQGSAAGRARTAAIAQLRELGLTEAAALLRAGQQALILPARPVPPPDPGQMLHRAWVLGDWPQVAATATAPHADLARRVQDAAPPSLAEGPPDLSQLVARLADSRALRIAVAELLTTPGPRVQE